MPIMCERDKERETERGRSESRIMLFTLILGSLWTFCREGASQDPRLLFPSGSYS